MTLYRRWPDVRALVGDVMTREWVGVALEAAPEADRSRPVREQLVAGLVAGVQAFREHLLLRKILDVDPEMLLPYMLDRRGASQDALLEFIADTLCQGHADGSIRADHVVRQARTVLLVVQSFALSLQTMTDTTDPDLSTAAFRHELRHILERTLTP